MAIVVKDKNVQQEQQRRSRRRREGKENVFYVKS